MKWLRQLGLITTNVNTHIGITSPQPVLCAVSKSRNTHERKRERERCKELRSNLIAFPYSETPFDKHFV